MYIAKTMSGPKKILIVDDEAAVRSLLRGAVAPTGFSTFVAESAAVALDLASREGPFDLVITDILMPGMDGFELAQELCSSGNARAFIFISGYCDAEQIADRLCGLPSAVFVSKPFSIVALLENVHRLVDEAGEGARVLGSSGA